MKNVSLVGAFDRFNYGDLLFPLIFKNVLLKRGLGFNSDVFGLIASDLSRFGAAPTKSMRDLYRGGCLKDGDAVVYAGGGTIGVDWSYMHGNLRGQFGNAILYYIERVLGRSLSENFSRLYFGSRSPFPWVTGPQDFRRDVSIAYNAVGASEYSNLSQADKRLTIDRLRQAKYISVRDRRSQSLLMSDAPDLSVNLSPDSAIIMAEQFPVPWLKTVASVNLVEEIAEAEYLCFQANIHYVRDRVDSIVGMLEAVYEETGLRSILLPIGRCVGLDDQFALREIHSRVRTPCTLVSDRASVWDIMISIASAKAFVGTSLHGNITSQAFAVPHIGLSEKVAKLDYYLQTWDLPEQSGCIDIPSVSAQLPRLLDIPKSFFDEKSRELLVLVHENFDRLIHACLE